MRSGLPSATAFRVAERRAAHQLFDRPLVLDDPVALRIIGPERAEALRRDRRAHATAFERRLRAFVAARSRCAEEALAECVARGAGQYVVLGAGLDTFALRNPWPPAALRVFEVDHPDTQAWKLELLERAGIPVPEGVTFVPVDFASQAVGAALDERGFRAGVPTFFSWLGVTMYLERDVVIAMLRWIAAATPAGSGVVFDYTVAPAALGWFERMVFDAMARRVAAMGEPWRGTFDPRELVPAMREMGYAEVRDLRAREINARWFADRADGLRVGALAGLVQART